MSKATPQEPPAQMSHACKECGRPAAWPLQSCTVICSSVADMIAGGTDPHEAARAHQRTRRSR